MNKRVCVIGAGPSGLVSVKELLTAGLDVTCYEGAASFGGAFRDTKHGGRSYDSLELTVSNYFMAYSDFPPEEKERRYWKVKEYRAYLSKYINHFGLGESIHYSHEVKSARMQSDKVVVNVFDKENDVIVQETFDHLVVCTGSNYKPNVPPFEGIENFKGRILHSSEYTNATEFKGKNVLCVGLGESGADISHEISQVASCKVLVRDYPNVVPRWIHGHTNDAYTSRCYYSMGKHGVDLFMKLKAWYYINVGKSLDEEDVLLQKWIYARKSFIGKFLTKNDIFVQDIINKKLELIKDNIKTVTPDGVKTLDGKTINADVIVFNTGYQTSFEHFSFGRDFENPRALYKQMLHPKYKTQVSIIGWARPSQGGWPACSEMQARLLAQLITNKTTLPNEEQLKKAIARDSIYYTNYFSENSSGNSLVNYYDYMKDMSKLIGCNPKQFYLSDIKLSKKMFLASHLPMFYRLNDKSKREQIENIIKTLPNPYSNRRIAIMLLVMMFYTPVSSSYFYLKNLFQENNVEKSLERQLKQKQLRRGVLSKTQN